MFYRIKSKLTLHFKMYYEDVKSSPVYWIFMQILEELVSL